MCLILAGKGIVRRQDMQEEKFLIKIQFLDGLQQK